MHLRLTAESKWAAWIIVALSGKVPMIALWIRLFSSLQRGQYWWISWDLCTHSNEAFFFALIHSFHSQWESENCDLLSIFKVLSIHPFASAFHFQVLFNLLITLLNLLVLQETVFFCSSLCSSSSPALLLLKQHVIITGQRSLPAGVCVTTWQSICDQPEISCWLCTCSNIYSMFEVGVVVQSYCWRHTGEILGASRGQRSPSMRYLPITQL